MEDWQKKCYDHYVSSLKNNSLSSLRGNFDVKDYPYFRRLISKFLDSVSKNCSILDIGCGSGELLLCLKHYGYTDLAGIDISPEQVELAIKNGLSEVTCVNFEDFLGQTKKKYDLVFLMDVLEHLSKNDIIALLESISKCLKDNGQLIIHVPNGQGLLGGHVYYGDFTHQTCFTNKSLSQVLNISGYNEVKCYEDKPVVHGLLSLMRRIIWEISTNMIIKPFIASETGTTKCILSQNLLAICKK